MKYSSSLLQRFIHIQDNPSNIAKQLILKTCEIEDIQERKIPDSIVIGKVVSCEKHPDADKLSVCQVDCGEKGTFQILCGGANVTANIFVAVALKGTHVEKLGITIEPRKMRGLDSNGMICSKEEIGINEDIEKHNIRALQAVTSSEWRVTSNLPTEQAWSIPVTEFDFDDISDEDLGKPLKEKYPWLESFVMEVDNKSLTNRPDLTWHRGAATELHAMYDAKEVSFTTIKKRYEQFQDSDIEQILANSNKAKRKIISKTDGLNWYILLELNNIQVQTSSFFTRLQMIDMAATPRNNRVDFSNLFMLISGQPVHFFDAAKVEGNITIRNAKDKEAFTDLFWTSHELISTDIVIADDKKVLALAGIIWWIDSGVTEWTQNILVEIANFDPVTVRKTGTRLGLRTDAELRYEKNINPLRSLHCLLLFLDELKYYKKDLGSFEIGWLSYYISWNVEKLKSWKGIEVDFKQMEQFIFWQKIKDFEKIATNILTRLWFTLGTRNTSLVTPPIWRWPDDMNIPQDIYEEVARIYGYDKIKILPLMSMTEHVPYTDEVSIQRKIEDVLVRNFACNQVETYPRVWDKFNKKDQYADISYKLQNPTNPEMPYLRGNMNSWLLEHVAKNSKFFDEFTLFDIGKVWNKYETKEQRDKEIKRDVSATIKKWNFASNSVVEKMALGVVLYTKSIPTRDKDPFLKAKTIVETLIKEIWISATIVWDVSDSPSYHPKKQVNIAIHTKDGPFRVWFLWSLHPLELSDRKISETAWVVYIALDLDKVACVLKSEWEQTYVYETLQDQILWRDICFVVDADKDFGPVLEAVQAVNEVRDLEIFDVYQWTNLPEGKKSVAFRIKITWDPAKVGAGSTMTSEQINDVMNKAIKAGEKVGGMLRS